MSYDSWLEPPDCVQGHPIVEAAGVAFLVIILFFIIFGKGD